MVGSRFQDEWAHRLRLIASSAQIWAQMQATVYVKCLCAVQYLLTCMSVDRTPLYTMRLGTFMYQVERILRMLIRYIHILILSLVHYVFRKVAQIEIFFWLLSCRGDSITL